MTEQQLNRRLAPYLVLWALALMALLWGGVGCTKPEPPEPLPAITTACNSYWDFNPKPSRTIWQETGVVVAPTYVVKVHWDGAVDLMCFPGPGLCPRVCRDQIPFQTVNPNTKQGVNHEALSVGDTIWWGYYGASWF
jgi:hypothetical protein